MYHTESFNITFGDCDPAGIVFYPNTYRWMDAAFHSWLRPFGGHAELCRTFGALGIGLVEAQANFKSPMRDGDLLSLTLEVAAWQPRILDLSYRGTVGQTLCFTGSERRALFIRSEGSMRVGDMGALRKALNIDDKTGSA
ncbi:acyl-CoA thioesterase [Rhodophyticola sp. SM2404]